VRHVTGSRVEPAAAGGTGRGVWAGPGAAVGGCASATELPDGVPAPDEADGPVPPGVSPGAGCVAEPAPAWAALPAPGSVVEAPATADTSGVGTTTVPPGLLSAPAVPADVGAVAGCPGLPAADVAPTAADPAVVPPPGDPLAVEPATVEPAPGVPALAASVTVGRAGDAIGRVASVPRSRNNSEPRTNTAATIMAMVISRRRPSPLVGAGCVAAGCAVAGRGGEAGAAAGRVGSAGAVRSATNADALG
jgi:hypothetical protein